jgi:hypothetical protein
LKDTAMPWLATMYWLNLQLFPTTYLMVFNIQVFCVMPFKLFAVKWWY